MLDTTIKSALQAINAAIDLRTPLNPAHVEFLTQTIHGHNVRAGWWSDIRTGEPIQRNVGELLALITSELTEALEGYEDHLQDDKLPHRPMFEVELADTEIRILDMAGGLLPEFAPRVADLIRTRWTPFFISSRSQDTVAMVCDVIRFVMRALEDNRKGRDMTVNIAKAFLLTLRIGVLCGQDVPGAAQEKFQFNKTRPDHQRANRVLEGGKAY